MKPLFETERLFALPWSEEHVDYYLKLSTDIGYNCFTAPPGRFLVGSRSQALERIHERMSLFEKKGLGKFPLFLKDTMEFIGTCGLDSCKIEDTEEVELGFRLLLEHWDRGYASEAAAAVVRYGLVTRKFQRVVAFALPNNRPSIRVIEKLGFRFIGGLDHAGVRHSLYEKRADKEARSSIHLRAIRASDADALFPEIYRTAVTDTIQWDGPDSLESYRSGLVEREAQVTRGEKHFFAIVDSSSEKAVGCIDLRPQEDNPLRGDLGLLVGVSQQGKGFGTAAVAELLRYGFEKLRMKKMEALVFVGNLASRRIFEKNGFRLEGEIRRAVLKRGEWRDEWVLGITQEDWLKFESKNGR